VGEQEPSLRAPALVGTVIGRYVLVRLLGVGGMGAVYEAKHQDLGRCAAVKTLHERYASEPNARQRFLREGQSVARIRHVNVVDVYDVGIDGEHPYLVMELLDGENLAQFIERQGRLSVQQAADFLVPVVAAVAAARDHAFERFREPLLEEIGRVEAVASPPLVLLADAGSCAAVEAYALDYFGGLIEP
jgi:eukaryotic-like serine/threonine-protein kinase